MTNAHLAIIAALVIAVMVFVSGYNEKDMASFQKTISRKHDFQAYDDKPLLPESAFKEVEK
jgi:hypothetical protein